LAVYKFAKKGRQYVSHGRAFRLFIELSVEQEKIQFHDQLGELKVVRQQIRIQMFFFLSLLQKFQRMLGYMASTSNETNML
jgi:hypothetical protein